MTTAYQRWLERDPARQRPEVDFGTTWTSERHPGETWRVTFSTGTGELVAVTRAGDDAGVLGRFDSVDAVVLALPHLAHLAQHPSGLDELRHGLAWRAPIIAAEAALRLDRSGPDSPPAPADLDDRNVALIHRALTVAHRDDLSVSFGEPTWVSADPASALAQVVARAAPEGDPRIWQLGIWSPGAPLPTYFSRRPLGDDRYSICIAQVDATCRDDIDAAVTDGLTRGRPAHVELDPSSEWNRDRRLEARDRQVRRDAERAGPDDDTRAYWWDTAVWDDHPQAHVFDDEMLDPATSSDRRSPTPGVTPGSDVIDRAASPPVYGIVIRPDGSTTPLHEPITTDAAARHVGTDVLDAARVRPDIVQGRCDVMMWVDDSGHAKGLSVNPLATLLYGSAWPILGTAVVFDDRGASLPRSLSDGFTTDPQPGPDVDHADEPNTRAAFDADGGPEHELGIDMDPS